MQNTSKLDQKKLLGFKLQTQAKSSQDSGVVTGAKVGKPKPPFVGVVTGAKVGKVRPPPP